MADVVNQAYNQGEMARRLIGEAVEVAAGVARHVIWYLSYQMEGTTHEEPRG